MSPSRRRVDAPTLSVLCVTWDGGGNVPPQLGLARRLVADGHDVRVLADVSQEAWVTDTGARFLAHRPFAPEAGAPEGSPVAYWFGRRMADGARTALAEQATDVVVIDNMLASVFALAEVEGIPSVAVFHQPWSFYYGGCMTNTWEEGTAFANSIREGFGLQPVGRAQDVWDSCRRVLVSSPKAFDVRAPDIVNANVAWVGPIVDDPPGVATGPTAAPPGDEPLVVVSLSTTDMAQGPLVAALAEELARRPVRAVITTGFAVDPATVPEATNVAVVRYANHLELLDGAAAVITHAGHGTVMASLARGVPMVCVPLGRDQHDMAAFIQELGCGLTVDGETKAEIGGITGALDAVLVYDRYRDAARRLADDIDPAASAAQAARMITEVAGG